MPSIQSPLGALPSRFRRQRVLIVGCGDVGLRVAKLLQGRVKLLALTSSQHRIPELRDAGVAPLVGNLDEPATLRRLAGIATRVLHLAPPAQCLATDVRTRQLLLVLHKRTVPRALVYASTSGVYGDCGGAWAPETRSINPQTPRAQRRADAEAQVRIWGKVSGTRVSVLRIPGIYALNRQNGTPRERLMKGLPVLCREEDVYTSHIHANDLARVAVKALWQGPAQRVFNVCDDTALRMGDYFDLAADKFQLPRPQRITRSQAEIQLSPLQLSFMGESRRLVNTRIKRELRVKLSFPTVVDGLTPRTAT